MNTINGIPFIWDNESDSSLLGNLLPNAINTPQNTTSSNYVNNNPFGNESLFYNETDNNQKQTVAVTDNGYFYNIYFLDSGVEVIEAYQDNAIQPDTKEIKIFIEKNKPNQSNLFGTVYRVKMGEQRKQFMKKLYTEKAKMVVDKSQKVALNLKGWCAEVKSQNSNLNINTNNLYAAVLLEIKDKGAYDALIQSFLSVNNTISDLLNKGAEGIEQFKLTDKNYDYGIYSGGKGYAPIIPVFLLVTDTKPVVSKPAQNSISILQNNFNKISVGTLALTAPTPTLADDLLVASLLLASTFDNPISETLKPLFLKCTEIIDQLVKSFEYIDELVAKITVTMSTHLNALWCGLVNGLLSLLQTILSLLGFIISSNALTAIENAPTTKQLEQIEDLIDFVNNNLEKIVFSFLNITNPQIVFQAFYDLCIKLQSKYADKNSYFWAYVAGAIIFEIIADVVLIYFTAGGAAVEKAIKSYTSAIKSIQALAKKAGKQAFDISKDLIEWLQAQLDELLDALKNDNLSEWFSKKIDEAFGEKPNLPIKIIVGKFSKRSFDINNCGGKILDLIWENAEITKQGIEIVKKHLSRFEEIAANRKMIERLEKIENGQLDITDWDKRFFTHEIREFERYKNLGYENVLDKNIPDEIYYNAHSATLEDYKLFELDNNGKRQLYHPEINEIDFFSEEERKLLGL